jgi:hypothetical protein
MRLGEISRKLQRRSSMRRLGGQELTGEQYVDRDGVEHYRNDQVVLSAAAVRGAIRDVCSGSFKEGVIIIR